MLTIEVSACPQKIQAVLDYAFKLTTTPHAMIEAVVQQLRDCELADEDILTINLIASYFNFVTRIALGLGVAFTPDEVEGYKPYEASAVMPTAQTAVYGAQLASES